MLHAPLARVFGMIAACLLAGCLPERGVAERITARKGPNLATPMSNDLLILQTVLIEQSLGDDFLDSEIWKICPSAVSGEQKALLAENGLRSCVIRGHAPKRFLELLTSEQSTVHPQMLTFSNRKQEMLATNGPVESAEFQVIRTLGREPQAFSLRQAGFGWQVRPEAVDGFVKIVCEPHVQHGERQDYLRPSGDGTQFTLQGELPVHRFPELSLTATLAPQDFLVIGGVAEPTNALGCAAFRVDSQGQSCQRVLVIRAGKRVGDASDKASGTIAAIAAKPK